MATSARYFDLVREMKDAYNHRLRLVESAKQRGIKPTAQLSPPPYQPSANGYDAFSSTALPLLPLFPALVITSLKKLP